MSEKVLRLKDIEIPFRFRMNKRTSMVLYAVDLITEWKTSNYTVDFDVYLPKYGVNLQRDFVWTEQQKSDLIVSILKDIPIPPLSVIVHEHCQFQIIDGKQRLGAIMGFLKGEFPIIFNNEKYYIDELDKDAKRRVQNYTIIADVAYEYDDELISDDEKIQWFLYVNYSGTPQNSDYLSQIKNLLTNNETSSI